VSDDAEERAAAPGIGLCRAGVRRRTGSSYSFLFQSFQFRAYFISLLEALFPVLHQGFSDEVVKARRQGRIYFPRERRLRGEDRIDGHNAILRGERAPASGHLVENDPERKEI